MDLQQMEQVLADVKAHFHYRMYLDSLRLDIGGPGSGNWGHAGRKGLRGGSAPGGGSGNRYGSKKHGFMSKAKRERYMASYQQARQTCSDIEARLNKISKNWTSLNKKHNEARTALNSAAEARDKARADWEDAQSRADVLQKQMDGASGKEKSRLKSELDKAKADAAAKKKAYDTAEKAAAKAQKKVDALGDTPQEMNRKAYQEYSEAAAERDRMVKSLFRSAEECTTEQEATDYLRANRLVSHYDFDFTRDSRVSLKGMSDEMAVTVAMSVEKIVQDYPMAAGRLGGIRVTAEGMTGNTYAYANGDGVAFNPKKFGSVATAKRSYEKDLMSMFHPKGTDYRAIIDHEFTHVLESVINQANQMKNGSQEMASDRIMKQVVKELGLGHESFARSEVSGYAAHSAGADNGAVSGKNTEFLAEAVAEYRNSSNPGRIAVIVGQAWEKLLKDTLQ